MKHVCTFLGLLILIAPAALHAQRTTGAVVGTLSDDTGALLPGVTVNLAGARIVGTQTTSPNEQGFYRFPALPPGQYELTFTLSGFAVEIYQLTKLQHTN